MASKVTFSCFCARGKRIARFLRPHHAMQHGRDASTCLAGTRRVNADEVPRKPAGGQRLPR